MKWLAVALALVLPGCAMSPGPVAVTSEKLRPIRVPAECTSSDPAWAELPDKDVRQSELARLWRTNRWRYRSIVAMRRVCRASIEAQKRPG